MLQVMLLTGKKAKGWRWAITYQQMNNNTVTYGDMGEGLFNGQLILATPLKTMYLPPLATSLPGGPQLGRIKGTVC